MSIYLILALLGAILPTISNIHFYQAYGPGFDILEFIRLANINPASESLSRDLLIGSSAVFFWIVTESNRLKMKYLWLVFLSGFTISFAFAAPLFLFFREITLNEMESKAN
tara:strand:- start:383 stop:715 length:333 start_codon:yes stop_codon:yes gene_type:complete